LGPGLRKYDFHSPKSALQSVIRMRIDNNYRAMMELEEIREGADLKERLKTLEISKEADWGGRKVLFVSFEKGGIKRRRIEAVEKDARTGFWLPHFVSPLEVRKTDEALANEMERWEKQAGL